MDRFATQKFRSEKINSKAYEERSVTLDVIMKWISAIYLFMIPLFFLPTPWGIFEHSRSVLTLVFAVLLVGMSLIKIFSGIRFELTRNLSDIGVIVIYISVLLATLFSSDVTTSIWGYDHRLGSGFLVISTVVLIGYLMRAVVKSHEDISFFIRSLVWGLSLSALMSLIGSVGTDLYGSIFGIDLLVSESIPLVGPTDIAIRLWGLGFVLITVLIAMGNDRKYRFLHMIAAIVLGFSVIIFSMGVSFAVVGVFLALLVAITLLFIGRRSVESRSAGRWMYVISGVLLVGVLVVKIPQISDGLSSVFNVAEQVSLDGQTTWQISIAALADTVKTGFVGAGQDTFPVIYNAYRPMYMGDYDLSNTTYTTGNSEFMTIVGTRGLLGAIMWLAGIGIIGVYVFRVVSGYMRGEYNLTHAILSVSLIGVLVLSFFVSYGFMLFLMMILLVAFAALIEATNSPMDANYFVIQVDLQSERVARAKKGGLNVGAGVAIGIVMLVALLGIGRLFMSSVYAIQAENFLAQKQVEIASGKEYTGDDQREFTKRALDLYSKSINLDKKNSYLYRKSATYMMSYIESKVTELTTQEVDKAELQTISENLDVNIKNALKLSEKSTEIAPLYYKNWDVQSYVLSRLVAFGYSQYLNETYSAMDVALRLNPNNPGVYYNVALLYEKEGKYSDALNAVEQGLNLRLDLEPILFAAQLNIELDRPEESVKYFKATITALEQAGAKDSDLYNSVVQRLQNVEEAITSGNTESLKQSTGVSTNDASVKLDDVEVK